MKCPECGAEMNDERGQQYRCPKCGRVYDRDDEDLKKMAAHPDEEPVDPKDKHPFEGDGFTCKKCGLPWEHRVHKMSESSAVSYDRDDEDLKKMSIYQSFMKCPYCRKTVSMSAGQLGEHRSPGGLCPGGVSTMAGGPPSGWVVKTADGRWYRITGPFKDGWATARTTDGANTKVDIHENDIVEARPNLPTGSGTMQMEKLVSMGYITVDINEWARSNNGDSPKSGQYGMWGFNIDGKSDIVWITATFREALAQAKAKATSSVKVLP